MRGLARREVRQADWILTLVLLVTLALGLLLAVRLRLGGAILVLGLVVLPEQLEDVEVLLFEVDLLLVKALRHNLGLLSDRLGAAVNLLQNDLHHGSLELGQHAHLRKRLLRLPLLLLLRQLAGGSSVKERRDFDALRNPLCVLALLLLNAFLNVLWVVPLKYVGLALETLVEFCQVLDEVLHSLGALLFL